MPVPPWLQVWCVRAGVGLGVDDVCPCRILCVKVIESGQTDGFQGAQSIIALHGADVEPVLQMLSFVGLTEVLLANLCLRSLWRPTPLECVWASDFANARATSLCMFSCRELDIMGHFGCNALAIPAARAFGWTSH